MVSTEERAARRAERQARRQNRHRASSFIPSGIAGRLGLVLVLLLIVAIWVSMALYVRDRARTSFVLLTESVSERISVIVPMIERTPPARRDELIRALNSPTLWIVATDDMRQPRIPRGWRRLGKHEADFRSLLPDLGDRQIVLRRGGEWRDHPHPGPPRTPRLPGGHPAPPDLLQSRVKGLIAVEMETGGWIHFVVSTDTTSLRWVARAGAWGAASTLLIVLIAFWATWRMTRPLRDFADAAERIGLDVRSPPLPEHGPRELRNATRAFNQMQERLRRFVDDRTMMLAAISHDLRTMLTRLKLRAEFIDDAEQQRKAISDLDEMQAMLDSTLAFARDDAADEPRTQTDISALVRSVCDDIADTGQTVNFAGPDRLSGHCAPGAIKRAVQNLVVNAVKYGVEASVTVTDGQDAIEIAVADKGPGIAADKREDVFRPFFRLETSRNRETGGSGLGLAVARSIVRRHGGDIILDDRDGGGLIVRLSLPHTPPNGMHTAAGGPADR